MWKRARCDCGAILKTYVTVGKGMTIKEEAVYCDQCRQWMRRVRAMDVTSLIDCEDPRPALRAKKVSI